MALVRGRIEALSLENMTQMAITFRASHFNPRHSKRQILVSHQGTRNSFIERRPPTMRIKLGQCLVQWLVARYTFVDSRTCWSLVVLSRIGCFCAQLSEDTKLFGRQNRSPFLLGFGHCSSEYSGESSSGWKKSPNHIVENMHY